VNNQGHSPISINQKSYENNIQLDRTIYSKLLVIILQYLIAMGQSLITIMPGFVCGKHKFNGYLTEFHGNHDKVLHLKQLETLAP
jgi:hypothetical protein